MVEPAEADVVRPAVAADDPEAARDEMVRERLSGDAVNRKGALEVRYEGESLHLAADRDLTLVCGKAKLTLRFDGRIELNGTNILSASRGPHRIKGATVAIN